MCVYPYAIQNWNIILHVLKFSISAILFLPPPPTPVLVSSSLFLPFFSILCEVNQCWYVKWKSSLCRMNRSHYIYLLSYWWTFSLFQYFIIRSWFIINILLTVFWYAFARIFLDCMVGSRIAFQLYQILPNYFPLWLEHQQYIEVYIARNPHQYLRFWDFKIFTYWWSYNDISFGFNLHFHDN